MNRTALCVGVNAYPSSSLAGCVNDALDWRDALLLRGYDEIGRAHV